MNNKELELQKQLEKHQLKIMEIKKQQQELEKRKKERLKKKETHTLIVLGRVLQNSCPGVFEEMGENEKEFYKKMSIYFKNNESDLIEKIKSITL